MEYWLFVTSSENWKKCRVYQLWGVEDRYKLSLKKAHIGDKVVVHLRGMKCAAIVRIIKEYFYDSAEVWSDRIYPHRIGIREELVLPTPVSVHELYENSSVLSSKGRAAGYFRSPTRVLPKEEFMVFYEFVKNTLYM